MNSYNRYHHHHYYHINITYLFELLLLYVYLGDWLMDQNPIIFSVIEAE